MAKAIELRQRAAGDIDAIIDHYRNEAGEAVALGFVGALETAFGYLGKHPQMGSLRISYELDIPDLRSWPLKGFPYLVFYVDTKTHLDVWRILHTRQDVPNWITTE